MPLDYTYDRMEAVNLLKKHVGDDRFQHSLRVEKGAIELAKLHGADEAKAGLAGLLHDIMKETRHSEKERMKYGLGSPTSRTVHGPFGAWWLYENGYVDDEDVLNAIRYHTTGREAMSELEKIVYLADVTEPGRKMDIDVRHAWSLAENDLDEAMLYVLSNSLPKILDKHRAIDPRTVEAYNFYFHKSGVKKRSADSEGEDKEK